MSSFSVDFDDSQEPYIIDSNPESGKQMGFAFEPFHTITQSTKYEFANGSEEKKQIRMLCAIIKSDLFLFSKINHELCMKRRVRFFVQYDSINLYYTMPSKPNDKYNWIFMYLMMFRGAQLQFEQILFADDDDDDDDEEEEEEDKEVVLTAVCDTINEEIDVEFYD